MSFANNSLMFAAVVVLFTFLELPSYSLAGTSGTNLTILWTADPHTCLPVATVVIPDGQSYTAKCGSIGFNPSDTCQARKRSKRGAKPGALVATMVNVYKADYQLQGNSTAKTTCPDVNVRDTVFGGSLCETHPTMLVFPARDPEPNGGCKRALVIKYSCAPKDDVECEAEGEDEGVGLEDPHGMPPPEFFDQ